MTDFRPLRRMLVLLLSLLWATTGSFAVVNLQSPLICGVSMGYDAAESPNCGYDNAPLEARADYQSALADTWVSDDLVPGFIAAKGGVDLTLKYKADWTPAQRAAADAKAAALTKADTVVTPSVRSGTTQARYRREAGLGPSVDDDHTIDLQLGGADDILNMSGLDSSVNRSLGPQINHQIKKLPLGTRVNNVRMVDP